MHALGAGFFLHDIGKVYIDEAIINKPGKLTEEEMNEQDHSAELEVAEAVEFAETSPEPAPEDLYADIVMPESWEG